MRCFVGVVSLFVILTSVLTQSEHSLQLVHVIFRHGDRTPDKHETYPNDPYTIKDFLPMGYGQLTNIGKQRAYKLGKLLRKKYDAFLGEIYKAEMVEMVSTDYDRTKMSALLVLAGLFPPAPAQKWDDELSWLPIPYFFEKETRDYFIRRPTHYCPKYVEELSVEENSQDVHKLLKENTRILDYIANNTGKPMETLQDIFEIYQTIHAEENMNLTLPKWTEIVYPDIITKIASKRCEIENSSSLLKRLNGGRMLKKILQHIKGKAAGILQPEERKIYLFSGHENNVINILAALNIFETHFPEYSAAVIIELHYFRNLDQYGVKVTYARNVEEEPVDKTIPGCATVCPLNTFITITQPHVPVNYTLECESKLYLGE